MRRRENALSKADLLQKVAELRVLGNPPRVIAESVGLTVQEVRQMLQRKVVKNHIARFSQSATKLIEVSAMGLLSELMETAREARTDGKYTAAVAAYGKGLDFIQSPTYKQEFEVEGEDIVDAAQDTRDLEAELAD